MKYASVTWLALGLLAASFTACATSERPEFGNQPSGGDGGFGGDVGNGGSGGQGGSGEGGAGAAGSTSSSSSTGGGAVCAPQCSADADCQNSCPAAPVGASNCCDVPTKSCYTVGQTTCPTGTGGTGGSMY